MSRAGPVRCSRTASLHRWSTAPSAGAAAVPLDSNHHEEFTGAGPRGSRPVNAARGSAMELDGKVAVVTAGSRSIGRAIAERLLAGGASVVISGKDAEKGAVALAEMGAGDRAAFCRADARSQAETQALIDFAGDRYGRVDILVKNA